MLPAPIPDNEAERLASLHSYEILDTECEDSFDDIARLASRLLNTPIVLVSLIDSERLWFKARHGLDALETSRDASFCAHAILGANPFVVPDAAADPRFAANPLVTGEPHIRFYAGVPLINPEGFALGTLCVIDRVPRSLSDGDTDTLRGLARAVVTGLELHRAVKQVSRLAMTDPLTKLANRGAFIDALASAFSHQVRHHLPVALISLDLDGFKQINDRYGHATGDAALVTVARTLRDTIRLEDFAARLGGDEFALICNCSHGHDGHEMAERIRAAIEEAMQRKGWAITASVGFEVYTDSVDVDTAMRTVDELMYVAKNTGRNRVVGDHWAGG